MPLAVWLRAYVGNLRRANRRLADEAEAAREIMASAADGFFVWNIVDGSEKCSRRLAVLLDLPRGTQSGLDDILSRFGENDAAALATAVDALRRDGTGFELRLVLGDGSRSVLLNGTRATAGDGRSLADIIWFSDTGMIPLPVEAPPSPVSKTENRQPQDIATHDRVLDNLSTAIAIFDPDANLVFANPAYAGLWHLDHEWLARKPSLNMVLDRLRQQRMLPEVADFRAFKKAQTDQFGTLEMPVEDHLYLPNGKTLRSVVSPHHLGGLVFTYEDVSVRLDIERSYNTLIAVQGETLANLYEGVAVFGSDGRLKLSNPVFASLWNFSPQDVEPGCHVSELVEKMRPLFPDEPDWQTMKERIIARMMRRQPDTGRLSRTDGKVLDYASIPLPDGAVLTSYMDVTDSFQVEQALRQRADALQDANRLKSEFIANVSYEVRTPLNTLIGFSEILTAEYFGKLNPRQKEYSRGILESSQGLMSVIRDILDLATIEAGMMALELDTIDLHSMLASVLNLTRERARRKNIDLGFDCPSDIGWMIADEKRLKQVLFNLLSNAVRFTPRHGEITLKAARDDADIVFVVSDTGRGMDEAERERVIKAFEKGNNNQSRQSGAGLGLSLVKSFIELHDGSVEIKSSAKRGTTVICRLPSGNESVEPRP